MWTIIRIVAHAKEYHGLDTKHQVRLDKFYHIFTDFFEPIRYFSEQR